MEKTLTLVNMKLLHQSSNLRKLLEHYNYYVLRLYSL